MKQTKIFDKIIKKLSKNARSFITDKNGLKFLDQSSDKQTIKSLNQTPKTLPKNFSKYFSNNIFILPKYRLLSKKKLNIPHPDHIKNNLKISKIVHTKPNNNSKFLITSIKIEKTDNNIVEKTHKNSFIIDNLENINNNIIRNISQKNQNIINDINQYKNRKSIVLKKPNALQIKEEPRKRRRHRSISIKGNKEKELENSLKIKEKNLFDKIKKINYLLKLESPLVNKSYNVKDILLNDLKKERYNNKKQYYIGNKLSGLFHQKFRNSTIQKYKVVLDEN